MRKEDLIAFACRDWEAIAASKRRRWAAQKSRMEPAEALRIGDELRHHVSTQQPGWPTEEDRRNDLAMHVRISEILRLVKPGDSR